MKKLGISATPLMLVSHGAAQADVWRKNAQTNCYQRRNSEL